MNQSDADIVMALFAGAGLVTTFIMFLFSIFMIACLWKVYTKAGKPGWAAIVPIYNIVVLLEIVNKPIWWILLLLIPFVNFIFLIIIYHRLSLSFGKDAGFTIGLVLLGWIFLPILAFGSAEYKKFEDQNA